MNPDNGLYLPQVVPAERKLISAGTSALILSPEAERERQAMLDALAAEDAAFQEGHDVPETPIDLADRVKLGVCHTCGHSKLLFKPAMLCERCLTKAAEEHGLTMPAPATRRPANRAERRRNRRGR